MAEIILQDEFEPYLVARGFVRNKKVFRRALSDGLDMEVWLNPENRLKRVATVSVDVCSSFDDPEGPLHVFDQATVAMVLERGNDWRDSSYSPETPGWPRVIVEDFVQFTIPFIDSCRTPADLCDLLLSARINLNGPGAEQLRFLQTVWDIADRTGLPEYTAEVLRRLPLLRLSEDEHDRAVWWIIAHDVVGLHLQPPVPERFRLIRRLLPGRFRDTGHRWHDPEACRVCGDRSEIFYAEGVPLYAICDRCGAESGIDEYSRTAVARYRREWVARGMPRFAPERQGHGRPEDQGPSR